MIRIVILSVFVGFKSWAGSVLVIGDSHTVGFYGEGLQKALAVNHQVELVGSCGARALQYLEGLGNVCPGLRKYNSVTGQNESQARGATPTFSSLITQKPASVVISLGTNYLGIPENALRREAASLLEQIPLGTKCVWVGAPDIRGQQRIQEIRRINTWLKEEVEKKNCTFIDNSSLVSYEGGDGLHFNRTRGLELGQKTAEKILPLLTAPAQNRPAASPVKPQAVQ